jgi:hypothetical protein
MLFRSFKLAHTHVLVENYSKGVKFYRSKGVTWTQKNMIMKCENHISKGRY